MSIEFSAALSKTTYPGRGILLGRSVDGSKALLAYFIMGRSVNSRNRVFISDGDGIRTKAYDESKLSDPSLIIYAPLRVLGDHTIVTNGDQTDTIYDGIKLGGSFASALRTRAFEPDAPNFTPRISGEIELVNGAMRMALSILKSTDGGMTCERFFYEYDKPVKGEGRLIHTYQGDGDPLPSFTGEPTKVTLDMPFAEFGETVWNSLNADNKVSLVVRQIDIATGTYKQTIYNKNN